MAEHGTVPGTRYAVGNPYGAVTWFSRFKFKIVRRPDRRNGWDVLVVACWHKQQVTAKGIKDVIDRWERAAALNPCKFVNCTHPSRWRPPDA